MRIIFMGTPEFAAVSLRAIVAEGHNVVAVYAQPPRPAGRGYKLKPSAVQSYAESQNIPVETPKSFRRNPEPLECLKAYHPDVIVVAAYGLILPQNVLDVPPQGCINIHGSLLPKWRGAAPIHRAIEAGDRETGITIMQMDAGLDTGPMISKGPLPIPADETMGSLHDKMAQLGGEMIVETLNTIKAGEGLPLITQPETGDTYAKKVGKAEAKLKFTDETAETLERRIRAFNPFPCCWFIHNGERIKVWEAEVTTSNPEDKTVFLCKEGTALKLLTVQRAGKGRVAATTVFS